MSLAAQSLAAHRRAATAVVAIGVALALIAFTAPQRQSSRGPIDNRPIQLHWDHDDAQGPAGSMYNVARQVGAPTFWWNGYNGDGVDVALIDSGVAPVDGVDRSGKVVYGPDVSFESGIEARRNLDTFGHGTHMAGIIAGRSDGFRGIAPGARIVSLKAADALGKTSVSQVIAAIKWVVEHRSDGDLNIRVLNLSFGTAAVRPYQVDDLAFAVEKAWHAGIAVVVSVGNAGADSGGLSDPAFDPYVIAVGANNTNGTIDVDDDTVTSFSSHGDGRRDPDVLAPGKSVLSLRVPGSFLDQEHPEARHGDQLFRGSGTSQAAAVVSGAAALIMQQRPRITPDQLKGLLKSTAEQLPDAPRSAQGDGLIDLGHAFRTGSVRSEQDWPRSEGSANNQWAGADANGNSWSTADPNGNSWSNNEWTGNSWSGGEWTSGDGETMGNSWSSGNWLGVSWGRKPKGSKDNHPGASGQAAGQDSSKGRGRDNGKEMGLSWGKARRGGLRLGSERGHRDGDELGVSWGKSRRGGPAFVPGRPFSDENPLGISWGRKPRAVEPGGGRGIGLGRAIAHHSDPDALGISWGKRLSRSRKAMCT